MSHPSLPSHQRLSDLAAARPTSRGLRILDEPHRQATQTRPERLRSLGGATQPVRPSSSISSGPELPHHPLTDAFGRRLTYLRVSVTDRCNLRCTYCLPEDAEFPFGDRDFLRPEEIEAMVGALVRLGIRRVRLTGGEPLVRKDIVEIARRVKALPGVENLALSTNGTELARLAEPLREAGVDRVNISLDSLDAERFRAITRRGSLEAVWSGVEAALAAGFSPVKLNAVLLSRQNLDDVDRLVELTLDRPLSVRFIEMMPTASNRHLQPDEYVSSDVVKERIEARFGKLLPLDPEHTGPRTGPATAYQLAGAKGAVGFITPLSHTFCADCNRLRLTSRGELRLCLFADRVYPLRHLLALGVDSAEALETEILRVLQEKPAEHMLARGDYGNLVSFMEIGG
ncbi:MAG TPA: GTP 3',8-cyclase MoaA [Thermoanaerobaculia bacterium]|nr:GTP 3',8-cyclase MoaA [Thermoanaerobaculia bacterium]